MFLTLKRAFSMITVQRALTVGAAGRTHADRQQMAVGYADPRWSEGWLRQVLRSWRLRDPAGVRRQATGHGDHV